MPPKVNTSMRNKDQRLNTFTDGMKVRGVKEKIYWIDNYNDKIIEPLIECGFYYSPNKKSSSRISCYFCGKSETYEDNMDLGVMLKKHHSKNKNCHLSMIMLSLSELEGKKITSNNDLFSYWNNHEINEISNPHSKTAIKYRNKFFQHFPNNENSTVNIQTLSSAGFIYLPNFDGDDRVSCFYCNCSLEGWEEGDIPIEEHKNNTNKYCYFLETYEDLAPKNELNVKETTDNKEKIKQSLDLIKNDNSEKMEDINLSSLQETSIEMIENEGNIANNFEKKEDINLGKSNITNHSIEVDDSQTDSKRKHTEPLRRSKRIKSKPQTDPNDEYWDKLPDNELFDEMIGSKSDHKSEDTHDNSIISSEEEVISDDSFKGSEDNDQSYFEDEKSMSEDIINHKIKNPIKKNQKIAKAVQFNLDDQKNTDLHESPKKLTKKIKLVNKEFSESPQQYNTSDQNLGDYEDANINYLEANVIPPKKIKQKFVNKPELEPKDDKNTVQNTNLIAKNTNSKLDFKTSPIKSGLIEKKRSLNSEIRNYNILDTSFDDDNFEVFDIKKFLRNEKNKKDQSLKPNKPNKDNGEVSKIDITINHDNSDNNNFDKISNNEINVNDISGSTDVENILKQEENKNDNELDMFDNDSTSISKLPINDSNKSFKDDQNMGYSKFVEDIRQINQEISKSIESLSDDIKSEDETESKITIINSDLSSGLPSSLRKSLRKSNSTKIADLSFKIQHNNLTEKEIDKKFNYTDSKDNSEFEDQESSKNRHSVESIEGKVTINEMKNSDISHYSTKKDEDNPNLSEYTNMEVENQSLASKLGKERIQEIKYRESIEDKSRNVDNEDVIVNNSYLEIQQPLKEVKDKIVEQKDKIVEQKEKGVVEEKTEAAEQEEIAREEKKETESIKMVVEAENVGKIYERIEGLPATENINEIKDESIITVPGQTSNKIEIENITQQVESGEEERYRIDVDKGFENLKEHKIEDLGKIETQVISKIHEKAPEELILADNKDEGIHDISKSQIILPNLSLQAAGSSDKNLENKEKKFLKNNSSIDDKDKKNIIGTDTIEESLNDAIFENENEVQFNNTEIVINNIPQLAHSPLKKTNKLSGDYNALIEASTPQGYRENQPKHESSPENKHWKPASLTKFLDNISNFEETTKYLKGISTSKNELHNDFDSELTNFISAMPEDEENMTIHQWVKHCSSNCGKLIKDSFDEMIQFYESEYIRGLEVLRSLPTSD